ncbi:MAG TPA: hypothetical protein VFW33_02400 [Gemmataceae bacterium]|nr:hypothetical protein [Gemmataceae bacterium]
MNRSSHPFPSAAEGLALHQRLCANDPLAPADFFAAYLDPLLDRLAAEWPRCDPDLVQTAVHETVMCYSRRPDAYQPARHPDLGAYLRMAARRDLLNLLRKEGRARRKHTARPVVELGEEAGNIPGREDEPPLACERGEEAERRDAYLRRASEGLTPGERRVLELMLDGERATAAFADALGLTHLPAEEQELEVKRAKDRIKKRLRRGGDPHV